MRFIRSTTVGALILCVAGAAVAEENYREAEWLQATSPWETINNADARGGAVVRVKQGTAFNGDPNANLSASVGKLEFRFPDNATSANSTQYLWIRYQATNWGNDSVWLAPEGGAYQNITLPIGGDFQWINTGVTAISSGTGSVGFDAVNREKLLQIDQVYISDDANAVPGNVTPTEPTDPDPGIPSTSGTINDLFVNYDGSVALRLNEGFSQEAIAECPNNNGYAGVSPTGAPLLKSALLAAYTAGKTIRLNIDACYASWLKISGVYITD